MSDNPDFCCAANSPRGARPDDRAAVSLLHYRRREGQRSKSRTL